MSAEDLNRVHRRYIRVSNAFKSAWTFHQFLQGVSKVFTHLGPTEYPADFQTLYGELKEVSKNLIRDHRRSRRLAARSRRR